MSASVLFWRRTDIEGLERLELAIEPDQVTATATTICLEAGGYRIDHRWRLDPEWHAWGHARTVELEAALDNLALDDAVVTNSGRTPGETAEELLAAIGW